MKKVLIFLTICAMLTSCGYVEKPAPESSSTAESSISEEISEPKSAEDIKQNLLISTDCYRKENINIPSEIMMFSDAIKTADGKIIIRATTSDYQSLYYYTDENFSDFTLLEYEQPEELTTFDESDEILLFNSDGTFNAICTMTDHNGIILPREYDENFDYANFDYEEYEQNAKTSYMICTYSKDGKIITKTYFTYPDEVIHPDYGYVDSGMPVADGDSILQGFGDGTIRRIKSDGEIETVCTIEYDEDLMNTEAPHLWKDRDGKIVVNMRETKKSFDANGFEGVQTEYILRDFDNGKMGDVIYSCDENNIQGSPSFGYGDYRLIIPTFSELTGIKDDGTAEKIISWQKSSLDPMNVIIPAENNEFIGLSWNNSYKITRLVPRDMSELENVQIITVAHCNGNIVNEFNNSQSKYRVETIDYPYNDNNEKLNLDIISGNCPDIIFDMDYSTYLNYCKKGLFVNLYDYMDSELNKDMIMPNVITAFESGGKLFGMCDKFNINTLVVKSKFCDKENWTFDDMLELYDNAPDYVNHLYDGDSKMDMFSTMFYAMNDLIDYENATCDFNNPEFIKMLEFCNRFVDDVDAPEKWEDYEAFAQYNAEKFYWIGNDNTFIEKLDFVAISSYNLLKYRQAFGEDLTIVGYPSKNGKGGRISPRTIMAISEKCEEKQGAWEFFKYYMLNANYIDTSSEYSYTEFLPSLTESFTTYLEYDRQRKHSSGSVEYPSYTEEEAKMLTDYIMSCDSIGTVLDDDIVSICEEEAGIYFAGGQTAETTAEHIQNRVSILVSERQ